jgi:MSHA pilin protein MshC
MDRRLPRARRGFTLTEVVMVIVIMGILAVLVGPRFMSSQGFASRAFYDEAQAVVRFAQKTAIARRRTIFVCVAANEIAAIDNNDCTAPSYILHPLNNTAPLRTRPAPTGVTLSPVGNFSFDGLGRPSVALPDHTITFTSTITDDPARSIVIAAETGYVSR